VSVIKLDYCIEIKLVKEFSKLCSTTKQKKKF